MGRRPSAIRNIMKMADERNIRAMGLDPSEVISFAGGWVGHEAPDRLREIYAEICSERERFHEAGGYPPTSGISECREQLARMDEYLYGMEVSEDNILISNSSTQLTHDIFRTICDPGDEIILLDPTYANYYGQMFYALSELGENGYSPQIHFLRTFDPGTWEYIPDLDALLGEMEDVFREHSPSAMLIPSPDNPTGQVVPEEFMVRALELCQDSGAYLVMDYAYKTQCFRQPLPDYFSWSPAEHENLILIYSNSKWSRSLGRRTGWIVASKGVVGGLTQYLNYSCLCGDKMHQMAMAEFLKESLANGKFSQYIESINKDYQRAAKKCIGAIDEHCGKKRLVPEGGLYTVMELGEGADSMIVDIMKEKGVLLTPGSGFGESVKNGVRVSYGPLVNDLDKIEEGIRRLGEFLNNGEKV